MRNEFDEELSEEELKEYTERIRRLLDEEIDELFYRLGFVVTDQEDGVKAIMKYHLAEIRSNGKSAMVENLLMESSLDRFNGNLEEIEEEHDKMMEEGREKLGLFP